VVRHFPKVGGESFSEGRLSFYSFLATSLSGLTRFPFSIDVATN